MSRKNSHNEVSETQAAAARVMRALRWPLLATRGGMLLERLTRAFWPFWSWLFVIWTALAFHLLDQLSVELAYLAMLIGGALVLGFLVIGIRSFRWPSQAAALARLDGSLKGRPLSALADRQAIGANDAASARLWRAHLAAMAERNRTKAEALYAAIDDSGGFYANPVAIRARSWMNVPFTLKDAALDADFLSESKAAGLLALKGHRSVGGMRASIYNAMPIEGVRALTDFMADFARRHG